MSRIANGYFFFWGEQDWGSQWHPSVFTVDGVTFNCAEQFMMAGKARLFKDGATLKEIMKAKHPKQQKMLGRKVKNFKEEVWNSRARQIVREGNLYKFSQNPDLKADLLETGSLTLVEASPYDKIWGIGLSEDDPKVTNPGSWQGTNWLGEELMNVRKILTDE